MADWKIFQGGQADSDEKLAQLLSVKAPSWRQFSDVEQQTDADDTDAADKKYWDDLRELAKGRSRDVRRGDRFRLRVSASAEGATAKNPYDKVIAAVNAALYLRRPLMITGRPGSGKTSLAYAIAHELSLGPVLLWPITTRTLLKDGLYQYDAIARLQDAQLSEQIAKTGGKLTQEEVETMAGKFKDIGQYIRLGPVGTAFLPTKYPRVLLIDEIDKSDINLPNDLLNLFEEGEFEIAELKRLSKEGTALQDVESDDGLPVTIPQGKVRCREFPLIIMTSNGEREFPPAFYRRCLRVNMPTPSEAALRSIVEAHLGAENVERFDEVIRTFVDKQASDAFANLPTDQLLNLIYLLAKQPQGAAQTIDRSMLEQLLFNPLNYASDEDSDGDAG